MNLAHEFARKNLRLSVEQARKDYDGSCIDFAGDLQDVHPGARLAYFDNLDNPQWKYHAAVVIKGVVHDLWQDKPMRLRRFMRKIGADTVEYPAEEEDAVIVPMS